MGTARVTVWLLAVCLLLAGVATAKEGKTVVLTPAAKAAIEKAFPGATITAVGRESENGATYFEVDMTVDGKKLGAEVSPEGVIGEVESKVSMEELPAATAKAIKEACAGGRITRIEKHDVRGQPKGGTFVALDPAKRVFEVKYTTADGKKKEIEVTVDDKGAAKAGSIGKGDDDDDDEGENEDDDDDEDDDK